MAMGCFGRFGAQSSPRAGKVEIAACEGVGLKTGEGL